MAVELGEDAQNAGFDIKYKDGNSTSRNPDKITIQKDPTSNEEQTKVLRLVSAWDIDYRVSSSATNAVRAEIDQSYKEVTLTILEEGTATITITGSLYGRSITKEIELEIEQ